MGKRKEEEEEETPEEEQEEEEEAVDPKPAFVAECAKSACAHEVKLVEECAKRIEGHPGKDCAAWYFDAKTCIDHCVCFAIENHFFFQWNIAC